MCTHPEFPVWPVPSILTPPSWRLFRFRTSRALQRRIRRVPIRLLAAPIHLVAGRVDNSHPCRQDGGSPKPLDGFGTAHVVLVPLHGRRCILLRPADVHQPAGLDVHLREQHSRWILLQQFLFLQQLLLQHGWIGIVGGLLRVLQPGCAVRHQGHGVDRGGHQRGPAPQAHPDHHQSRFPQDGGPVPFALDQHDQLPVRESRVCSGDQAVRQQLLLVFRDPGRFRVADPGNPRSKHVVQLRAHGAGLLVHHDACAGFDGDEERYHLGRRRRVGSAGGPGFGAALAGGPLQESMGDHQSRRPTRCFGGRTLHLDPDVVGVGIDRVVRGHPALHRDDGLVPGQQFEWIQLPVLLRVFHLPVPIPDRHLHGQERYRVGGAFGQRNPFLLERSSHDPFVHLDVAQPLGFDQSRVASLRTRRRPPVERLHLRATWLVLHGRLDGRHTVAGRHPQQHRHILPRILRVDHQFHRLPDPGHGDGPERHDLADPPIDVGGHRGFQRTRAAPRSRHASQSVGSDVPRPGPMAPGRIPGPDAYGGGFREAGLVQLSLPGLRKRAPPVLRFLQVLHQDAAGAGHRPGQERHGLGRLPRDGRLDAAGLHFRARGADRDHPVQEPLGFHRAVLSWIHAGGRRGVDSPDAGLLHAGLVPGNRIVHRFADRGHPRFQGNLLRRLQRHLHVHGIIDCPGYRL